MSFQYLLNNYLVAFGEPLDLFLVPKNSLEIRVNPKKYSWGKGLVTTRCVNIRKEDYLIKIPDLFKPFSNFVWILSKEDAEFFERIEN